MSGVTVNPLVISAPRWRAIWLAVAAALNSVHTTIYATAKIHTLYAETPLRARAMRAYVSIIGLALGTIIATIITAHIMKVSHTSAQWGDIVAVSNAPMLPRSRGVIGIRTR